MSESELDAILNEIRNRGDGTNAKPVTESDIQNALDSFSIKHEPAQPRRRSNTPPPAEKKVDEAIDEPKRKRAKERAYEKVVENATIEEPKQKDEIKLTDIEPPMENGNYHIVDVNPAKSTEKLIEDFAPDIVGDEYEEEYDSKRKLSKKSKAIIIAVVAIIVAVAVGVGLYFGVFAKDKENEPTTTKPKATVTEEAPVEADIIANPLTGEAGYDASALTQRPVAVVVENEFSSRGVRPQWGLDEADIVLEGESECSTRTLLFWADYNKMPEKIGPTRSARPPFIHFSQLFDAVFIHAGLSRSKGSYVGADSVFKNEGIDHINLLSYSTDGEFMGRDYSRTSTVEHTGYLNGTNCAKLLDKAGVRTKLNESKFTNLSFAAEPTDIGTSDGTYAYFKWSTSCPDYMEVEYDSTDKVYRTNHFDSSSSGEKSNCKWTNCVFLFDNTTYVVKENYKHAGSSETYCNYALDGGNGTVLSNGKSVEIKWGVTNGKLWIKNAQTNEDITLNAGKTYIGYGSANHGGSITLTKQAE